MKQIRKELLVADYSRKMQKKNYLRQQEKMKKGLCARRDCKKPRAPIEQKRPGTLARCCAEHARQRNLRAKLSYQRRKRKRLQKKINNIRLTDSPQWTQVEKSDTRYQGKHLDH